MSSKLTVALEPIGPRGWPTVKAAFVFGIVTAMGVILARSLNWIPFGDHPLKLEQYRED